MNFARRLNRLESLLPASDSTARTLIDAETLAFAQSDPQAVALLERLSVRMAAIISPVTLDTALADPDGAKLVGDFARHVLTNCNNSYTGYAGRKLR